MVLLICLFFVLNILLLCFLRNVKDADTYLSDELSVVATSFSHLSLGDPNACLNCLANGHSKLRDR